MNSKLVLMSNLLEHTNAPDFIKNTAQTIPNCDFLLCGDLLNVFPEPGEDLKGSIFQEIFGGTFIEEGMNELVKTRFKEINKSQFLQPMRDMFFPTGKYFEVARTIAKRRYEQLFLKISNSLKGTTSSFYTIPGNMDYYDLALQTSVAYPEIKMLDQQILNFKEYRIAMMGGIPNSAHPFRKVVEISPYEMTNEEYTRRLNHFWGVDILVSHISLEEFEPISTFIEKSPAKMLIARAPFNFNRDRDFRGQSMIKDFGEKKILYIRPFEYPVNEAYIIDLENNLEISVMAWDAEKKEHPAYA